MNLVDGDNMTQNKFNLIRLWNQKELDFRLMYSFKN